MCVYLNVFILLLRNIMRVEYFWEHKERKEVYLEWTDKGDESWRPPEAVVDVGVVWAQEGRPINHCDVWPGGDCRTPEPASLSEGQFGVSVRNPNNNQ